MYQKKTKKTCLSMVWGVMAIFLFWFQGDGLAQEQVKDPQVHEASVSVQLLPLFAVDKNGNPVYDLKVGEMALYVSGKETPITFFEGYQLDMQKKSQAAGKGSEPVQVKTPERICFIIMDMLISNSKNRIKEYTLELAREIIKRSSPGDAFVLTETSAEDGLIYLLGPTKNREELLAALVYKKEIPKTQQRVMYNAFMRKIVNTEPLPGAGRADSHIESREILAAITMVQEDGEKLLYKKDIKVLTKSLMNLKYALKSTMLPKTVYLISAQSQLVLLGNNALSAIRDLEEGAKAVNYGGSLFYLINPEPIKTRGLISQTYGNLKFMADAAGGKLILGKKKEDIVSQLKKNTSAYYEMAFNSYAKEGHKSDIRMVCKRPGVSLTYLASSEQERTYTTMNEMERELYVLNIIHGGVWSKTTIPVKTLAYSTVEVPQTTSLPAKSVTWVMPTDTQNKTFHFYQVAVDDVTQKAEILFSEKTAAEKEQMTFNLVPGKKNYFVLINETGTVSYSNQVI